MRRIEVEDVRIYDSPGYSIEKRKEKVTNRLQFQFCPFCGAQHSLFFINEFGVDSYDELFGVDSIIVVACEICKKAFAAMEEGWEWSITG